MDNLATGAPFGILPPNAPPVERMPRVADFHFLPDMGRMTA
jgi:hypothetical protein